MRAIDINEHLVAELGTGEDGRMSYKKTFLYLSDLKIYPKKFAEEISKSAGLRNALVHDYDDIMITDLYNSIEDGLKQFHEYCDYILRFLDNYNQEV